MKVTATATRSGEWWAIEADVPGVFTQSKRLDQSTEMVADAVSLLTGVAVDEVEVSIRVKLGDALDADVQDVQRLSREAATLQERAQRAPGAW